MVPAGWPRDLAPPGTEEFTARVVPWLLDRGPGELRSSDLRTLPRALATYITHHVEASLTGARTAYSRARTELAGMPADELDRTLRAVEAEGARLLQVQREVSLVADELARSAVAGLDAR